MHITRFTFAHCLLCVTLMFSTRVYAGDATKFRTVPEMIEEFGDYSAEGRTFKLVSQRALHIQILPVVALVVQLLRHDLPALLALAVLFAIAIFGRPIILRHFRK